MNKKKLSLVIFLALMSCFIVAFAACSKRNDDNNGGGSGVLITYYITENSAPLTARVNNGNFSFTKVPTRELYVFAGMFDQPSGGSMIIDENGRCLTYIDRPLTLYAHWTPKSYTVSFAASEEYVLSGNIEEFTIAAGDTILYNVFPLAEKEGYDFVGWFAGDIQITDGTALKEDKRQLNEAYLKSVEGDKIVLLPKFKLKKFTVKFDLNYSTATDNPESLIFDYFNSGIPETDYPTVQNVAGKEFIGWSIRNDRFIAFEGRVTGNMTLYAVWRSYVTVNIDFGDGGALRQIKIYEDATEDYVPERNGYECVGCFTDKSYAGSSSIRLNYYSVKENTTYYAKFAVKDYIISFNTNCQTVLSDARYDIESEISLPDNLVKEHYTFVGWCLNEDLSDAPFRTLGKGNYGDKILYAKFKGDDISVVFSENSVERTSVIEYGSKIAGLPQYTGGAGYVFYGWYDSPEGGTRLSDENGVLYDEWTDAAGGAVLYARYEKKYYINLTSNIPSVIEYVGVKDYYLRGNAVEITVEIDLPEIYSLVCIRNKDSGAEIFDTKISFVMDAADYNFEVIINAKSFTVSFDYGDAWCKTDSQSVTYGETAYLPTAIKSGFDFDGWLYDGKKITDKNGKLLEIWTITENVTLVASFVSSNNTYIMITDENSLRGIFGNPSAKYYLANDIILTGDWTPADFAATLDGNGYRIINVNVSSASGNLGMFINLSGTVKNLVLENLNVTSTSYNKINLGGLCANLTGTVENVELKSGSITCEYADMGGIAGATKSSAVIRNCINRIDINGNLNEGDGSTGGIVGVLECSISGCKNYGAISGNHNTAGIVGYAKGTVSDCINYGKISGKNHTGGITGHIPGAAALSNLINEGEVTGANYVGGIFSMLTASQNVTYNAQLTNKGKVTGKDYVGGIGGNIYFNTSVNTGSDPTYTLTLTKMTNSGTVKGENQVGGIIGRITATGSNSWSSSKNCYGKITASQFNNSGSVSGVSYIGGLIGYGSATAVSTITGGVSSGEITASENMVGGLAGQLVKIKLTDCSNENSVVTNTGYKIENTTYYAYVGGYVGCGYAFENCHNAETINYTARGNYVGGIAGYANGELSGCTNTAAITAQNANYVGGIAGYVSLSYDVTMVSLTNKGEVTGKDYVGGIGGSIYFNTAVYTGSDPTYTLTLTKMTNSGTVKGENQVGGMIGRITASGSNSWSSSRKCYGKITASQFNNTGSVSGVSYIGGLIGYGSATAISTITGSTSSATIEGEYMLGGLAGQLATVKLVECSNEKTVIKATGYKIDGTSYYAYVGGYAGSGYAFENCHNTIAINYTARGNYVGGIAGYANGEFSGCTNTADITAQNANYVGGIAGYVSLSYDITMVSLTNKGEVTGKDYVGGIGGSIYFNTAVYTGSDPTYTLTLTKMTNSGTVKGKNQVGGMIGRITASGSNSWSSSRKCYGKITASQFNNSGSVSGISKTGAFMGYVSTTDANSRLVGCTQTGVITENGVEVTDLIREKVNITIDE